MQAKNPVYEFIASNGAGGMAKFTLASLISSRGNAPQQWSHDIASKYARYCTAYY